MEVVVVVFLKICRWTVAAVVENPLQEVTKDLSSPFQIHALPIPLLCLAGKESMTLLRKEQRPIYSLGGASMLWEGKLVQSFCSCVLNRDIFVIVENINMRLIYKPIALCSPHNFSPHFPWYQTIYDQFLAWKPPLPAYLEGRYYTWLAVLCWIIFLCFIHL